MKSDVYERKVYAWDELLARSFDITARIKERDDHLRQTTRDLRTRVAMCTAVDGGMFEHLLWTETNFSFLCYKFLI